MTISKGMIAGLMFLVVMTGFAGIGVLHVLQITGLVQVQVSLNANSWDYSYEPAENPKKK